MYINLYQAQQQQVERLHWYTHTHIYIYIPILTLLYIDCSQGTYGGVYFTTDQC